jgi:hypothetical protein
MTPFVRIMASGPPQECRTAVTVMLNVTESLAMVPGGGVSRGPRKSPRTPVCDAMQVTVGWLWLAFPPPLTWSKVNSVW